MFIFKKGHQPGVYVPLRALFLVFLDLIVCFYCQNVTKFNQDVITKCHIQ